MPRVNIWSHFGIWGSLSLLLNKNVNHESLEIRENPAAEKPNLKKEKIQKKKKNSENKDFKNLF